MMNACCYLKNILDMRIRLCRYYGILISCRLSKTGYFKNIVVLSILLGLSREKIWREILFLCLVPSIEKVPSPEKVSLANFFPRQTKFIAKVSLVGGALALGLDPRR